MQQELEAIESASKVIERITRKGRFVEFRLSNDIVLTIKPVPPLLLQAISQEFAPPPPPKVYIDEKGRDEENPSDPEYLRLLAELSIKQDLAVNDLVLAMGTVIKSIPEGYFLPQEDGWVTQVQFAANITGKKIEIGDDPIKRYLCWLRFYAMETQSDIVWCNQLPLQLVGIREGEVEEVMEFFRSIPERGTDTNSAVATGNQNGHTENRAARRSRTRD